MRIGNTIWNAKEAKQNMSMMFMCSTMMCGAFICDAAMWDMMCRQKMCCPVNSDI